VKYQVAQYSLRGGRPANEDRVGVAERDNAALMILADGLGGHSGGALAAEALVQTLLHAFQSVRQTVTLTADPQVIAVTPGFTPTRLVLDPDEKLYIDVKCLAPGDCPAGRTCGGGFCRR